MSPLQQDSICRLICYQMSRDEAKKQGKVAHMRKWTKALEEERRLLEIIKRVEAFNSADEQGRSMPQSGTTSTNPERSIQSSL